ncbi:MAG: Uncharacterized protein G01um101416_324 [Microgenomates group bacterium Gr01-1014_16]|nr:MAG: Uncharacterized protein G01um101416_324 [Microgenomates group bacterium Gr01-1014_16]
MPKNPLVYLLAGLSLFLLSAGISYFAFTGVKLPVATPSSSVSKIALPTKKPKIDPNLPRTEVCPLNGIMYTTTESSVYEKHRPLAVMIENHLDSRPTSGVSSADIVYEAVSEGGITRFMGLFYCGITYESTMFAPVRSARIYFTKLVPEYDALYNHVGGAGNCDDPTVDDRAKALCFIRTNKIKDLDQFGRAGDFKTCHRVTNRLDREVAYEHTMACYSDELYKVAAKLNWTNVDVKNVPWDKNFVAWKFKDDPADKGAITNISFDFWASKSDYSVSWKYDPVNNQYLRSNGGQTATDLSTGEQLSAKNVVIQFVKETGPLDEHLHMYYEVVGTGKALIFQDGQAITGTWTKASVSSRTKFFDDKGKEIQFTRGQTWIELVPSANKIEYN